MFVISEGTSNEGTEFTVALSPSQYDHYHAELIIHARETTEVTITTISTSEVVTVYGNSSLHYDLNYSMRTTNYIEDKGNMDVINMISETMKQYHIFPTVG